MKRKILLLLLAVASLGTMHAAVINGTCGDNLTWSLDTEEGRLTISGTGTMYNWEYGTSPWFEYNYYIADILLPEGLTYIGDYAFGWCSNLTSIELPSSVTSVGESAFYYCNSLSSPLYNSYLFAYLPASYSGSYIIPDGIEIIGKSAFYGCENLTSITMPNSVTKVDDYAFSQCTNLTSISFSNNLKTIGNWAFNECNKLSSIDLPNSLLSIGERAFRECYGLVNVSIPNGATHIGNGAFAHSGNLETVILPKSIIKIGGNTFIGCNHLVSIEIPNDVKEIGDYAFYQCVRLPKIEIPSSVNSLGNMAFGDCTALTSIYCYASIPPSVLNSTFSKVDKSTCVLYVPAPSISTYKTTDIWNDFETIIAIPGTEETKHNVHYLNKENESIKEESILLTLPVAPVIEGFSFLKWHVVESDLNDGIFIQAEYTADVPTSAPGIFVNPVNPSQKLIRNGNVYILHEENLYTLQGQKVK